MACSELRKPGIAKLDWRVDVSISTSSVSRAMTPLVLMEITTTTGERWVFEVPHDKLHELRYSVARVLVKMDQLLGNPILKNKRLTAMNHHRSPLAAATAALLLAFSSLATSQYVTRDAWDGMTFFENFEFQTSADPNAGYVNYLSRASATSRGLVSATSTEVTISPDTWTPPSSVPASGRDSVRVVSKKSISRGHILLAEVRHVPTGCGAAPSILLESASTRAQLRVVSGENLAESSRVSLRVPRAPGNCALGASRWGESNCTEGPRGCWVAGPRGSMGQEFNAAGGGLFVAMWDDEEIAVWFWRRSAVPGDVAEGAPIPYSVEWGMPVARFATPEGESCDPGAEMNLVIGVSLCGDLAGDAAFSAECPGRGACDDYVRENPSYLSEAYWSLGSVRVFETVAPSAQVVPTATSSMPTSSSAMDCSAFLTKDVCPLASCSWCASRLLCTVPTALCPNCTTLDQPLCGAAAATPGCAWCGTPGNNVCRDNDDTFFCCGNGVCDRSDDCAGCPQECPRQPGRCSAGWTCGAENWNSGEKCDCECGAWDPDCSLPAIANGLNCQAGSWCSAVSFQCVRCQPGTWDDDILFATQCIGCLAGTTDHDLDAVTACVGCPPGSQAKNFSYGECNRCQHGETDDDLNAVTPCKHCGKGHFIRTKGATGPCAKFACPSGTTDHDNNATTTCVKCDAFGLYVPRGSFGTCEAHKCAIGTIDRDRNSRTPCTPCATATSEGMYGPCPP